MLRGRDSTDWSDRSWPASDTRAAYATAKVLLLTDPVKAEGTIFGLVRGEAANQGRSDFEGDIHEPPIMFQDEPSLLAAWQRGHDLAESERTLRRFRRWHFL